MKVKNILRKYLFYDLTDGEALEEYFEDMAEKGLFIRDMNNVMTFEKKTPERVKYSVSCLNNGQGVNGEYICKRGSLYVFQTGSEKFIKKEAFIKEEYNKIKKDVLKKF
jgi:hypothetical protein